MNKLYQFIPKRFSYLTKSKKLIYKDINLKTDYIINILHELLVKYFFSEDLDSLKINLWSIILKKKYGMYYNYYINYLLEKEFIFLVSDYYVNKKAKTYRINSSDVSDIIRVNIYDTVLLNKHSKSYLERSITEYNNSPIPIDIRKKLVDDLYHIDIEYDKALNYLEINKDVLSIQKYYKNLSSIDGIKEKYLFFKFDSYGRFHSNFTILKKEIRNKYLTIDDHEVCEVDIKNSQPFFLSILMKKYKADWMEVKDIERYFYLTKEGLIYDDILENFPSLETRDNVKLLFYKVLFGKNGDFKSASKIFSQLYPSVFQFIKNYKESMGDHKIMSHELQKIESEFIFNTLIGRIIKEVPQCRLFTIHDSIIFPCKFREKVNEIFNQELKKLKG